MTHDMQTAVNFDVDLDFEEQLTRRGTLPLQLYQSPFSISPCGYYMYIRTLRSTCVQVKTANGSAVVGVPLTDRCRALLRAKQLQLDFAS